jgi:hypothetical protein
MDEQLMITHIDQLRTRVAVLPKECKPSSSNLILRSLIVKHRGVKIYSGSLLPGCGSPQPPRDERGSKRSAANCPASTNVRFL